MEQMGRSWAYFVDEDFKMKAAASYPYKFGLFASEINRSEGG